ncbi:molecular chaperone GrpE [Singulisphaera sp. GP187]|uniref:nucleotide exchange factor GrpE n=1 Tax=Singulisphaera sp. GP187 TaxID=1882752 RepID=UPI000926A905|nr:nucleotide exchange factor GrpE [Singulisphaera sp. GP187]SIO59398.1 molecular chaperone GrpE [Singulisphaera sp. GP187]
MSDTTQQSENDIAGEPKPNNASATEDLGQVQRQRDEYFDQLQRTRAEFMNFQKRSKTQADSDRIYAVGSLARDLLDGIDNLERAGVALKATAPSGIHEGLDMVHKQLLATLAKHGVEPIEALGKPFDPNEHDALVQQPDAHHPEGTVVNELSKGYRIRERVLRPSKVAVSVKPAQS